MGIVLDTKTLQVFQHLARHLHFGKTADTYHMSPSTLSRLIQRVELQLDCPLFIRNNRSVELTSQGEKLLDYADQQLLQWQILKDSIEQQQNILSGKLHIYCSVTAAYSHLPPLMDKFRRRHPEVEIILSTGDAANAISKIKDHSVDIAIAAKPEKLAKEFRFVSLTNIPLIIIAPVHSSKIRYQLNQKNVQWNQVPFILPEHGPSRKRFDDWYNKKQLGKPTVYATVSGHEALVSMVALGCGVGISPKIVVENSPVKNRVEKINNIGVIKPFELGICCLNVKYQKPLINAFFESAI
jgi:LysR family positive regulator for ilvC